MKRNPWRFAIKMSVGIVLASLVGCSASSSGNAGDEATEQKGVIAFSHPNSTAPITKVVQNFAKEKANELGYDLVTDNANNDLNVQVASVETWIAQGVDAIVIFPVDTAALEQSRMRAQEVGIQWITYASAEEDADGAVIFPHDQSAELLAADAVDWINSQKNAPKVLILTGTGLPSISDRWTVLIDAISSKTDATIVAEQDALDQETGLSVTEAVLAANPDLRVVLGTNDDGALGALRAFEDSGVPVEESYIGGNDGSLEALEAVLAGGAYRASVAINVRGVGHGVAQSAVNLIEKSGSGFIEVTPRLGTLADRAGLDTLISDLR